ncbi:hypothetical protein AVEN_103967-1 [Araneus ventricosus]|uniref:Uncharacterized protein n=1 Tax=Araneus ventricosus TaxID=182803 RepID=A0A4Y2SXV2_ARAVE|nr:hypothetical protein AVEN_103967-1 [Araneus ventricosus]
MLLFSNCRSMFGKFKKIKSIDILKEYHHEFVCVSGRPPVGVVWKFGEGVPAQVSSSSSDRGSQLRRPSKNIPCISSRRDVNISKLNENNSPFGICIEEFNHRTLV